ncbi:response regulator transcription factor [Promicromonospora kroppenstedtii]|uniref:response regulator transcription factor n=1 Tax=Promicromonospora kroppenstedtii TaxID=440482 RepID=UPI0004B62A0A|nr:response regulator transcription factor [Promicromonospora kroppenstedtii]
MDLDARRLLLVEDDRRLSQLLVRLLTTEGYDVVPVYDGQAGLHHGLTGRWDALVIDRTLPAMEGVDLVRRLRSRGITTPTMLLTARGTTEDRVEGLDAGAEDYVVKPFDSDELLARLRALLRRHSDTSAVIDLGGRRLDVASRRVLSPDADPVELSAQECALLRIIAANPGRVRSREELHRRIFQNADSPNAVDTYVYYLRRKLGAGMIRTVRGLGYQLGAT